MTLPRLAQVDRRGRRPGLQWRSSARARSLFSALVVACFSAAVWPALGLTPVAQAADVSTVATFPNLPARAVSRLRITVDASGVAGSGLRPVRVTLRTWPPKPAVAERELLVELRPNWWPGTARENCAAQRIVLPEGSTTASESISVPQRQPWSSIYVEVSEHGRKLEEMSGSLDLTARTYDNGLTEVLPTTLVISDQAPTRAQRTALTSGGGKTTNNLPDLSGLNGLMTRNVGATWINDLHLLSELNNLPQLEVIPPTEIPHRWRDLSGFDLIITSQDELADLEAKHAQAWQAVMDWCRAGGNLCVTGVGDKLERLADLEKLVKLAALPVSKDEDPLYRGWTVPDPGQYRQDVFEHPWMQIEGNGRGGWGGMTVPATVAVSPSLPPQNARATKKTLPPVAIRPLGMGQVAAIGPENGFFKSAELVGWLLASLGQERWMWYQRHGMSLRQDNPDYWNFLIPGVGLAPVGAFRILITVFVIVIGPLNYFLLRRWRRLNWLLVTVPAGALLVTGGLFSYALVTDGLGVRSRVRSYTEIDQRTKQAVSWSRQSYYAGLAPSRGLTFPAQAVVYPLDQFGEVEYYYNAGAEHPRRRISWDDGLRLERGYVTSRSTSQLLVIHPQTTESGLDVTEGEDGAPPKVHNRLRAAIQVVLVSDSRGAAYLAQNVGLGEHFTPQPTTADLAGGLFRKLYVANRLEQPAGFDNNTFQSVAAMSRGRYYYYSNFGGGNLPAPRASTSLMESRLGFLTTGKVIELPARSYLAVVDRPGEVPLGLAGAREESGFHVVQGRW